MIACVTGRAGHGGWQRWRDNGPGPACMWDVAEQQWEQRASSDSAFSSLLSSGKLWSETRQTWDLWYCPFSLPVPAAVPPGRGPAEILTHRRESVPGSTSDLANIHLSKLSCTLAGATNSCLHLPLQASSCIGFTLLGGLGGWLGCLTSLASPAAFSLPSATFHPGGCPSTVGAEASPC